MHRHSPRRTPRGSIDDAKPVHGLPNAGASPIGSPQCRGCAELWGGWVEILGMERLDV